MLPNEVPLLTAHFQLPMSLQSDPTKKTVEDSFMLPPGAGTSKFFKPHVPVEWRKALMSVELTILEANAGPPMSCCLVCTCHERLAQTFSHINHNSVYHGPRKIISITCPFDAPL